MTASLMSVAVLSFDRLPPANACPGSCSEPTKRRILLHKTGRVCAIGGKPYGAAEKKAHS